MPDPRTDAWYTETSTPSPTKTIVDDHKKSAQEIWNDVSHSAGVLCMRTVRVVGYLVVILGLGYLGRFEKEWEVAQQPPKFKAEHFMSEDGLNQAQAKKLVQYINLCLVKNETNGFCKDSMGKMLGEPETAQYQREENPPERHG
jgi:hypothetical protein